MTDSAEVEERNGNGADEYSGRPDKQNGESHQDRGGGNSGHGVNWIGIRSTNTIFPTHLITVGAPGTAAGIEKAHAPIRPNRLQPPIGSHPGGY